jgi:glycosyltransferase involved in cell wall biosynthesis
VSPPDFSVVVPTFGRPDFLGEAIGSILRQTVSAFECIVVDDGSSTPPGPFNDSRVRVIRRPVNGGPAAARNTGIAAATGRYLAFLDDDDLWQPDRLEGAVDAHRRAPIAICWQSTLGKPDQVYTRVLEGNVRDTVLDRLTPHLGATSIERSVAPMFDERFASCEDVEWWLRATEDLPVATTRRVGLLYRAHDRPRGYTDPKSRVESASMLLEEYEDWFEKHPRAKAFRLMRLGLSALRVDDRRFARRCFTRSFALHPAPRTAWHALRTFDLRNGATRA